MKTKVHVADLTHTENGITAQNFPLGASFVASYAKMVLGSEFDLRLFKFPDQLSKAILDDPPQIMAMSNYSWNLELTYKMCTWAKQRIPNLIVVFGGPNFPSMKDEKLAFLQKRPVVDFYIEAEGELGFVELLSKLNAHDFDVAAIKQSREVISNCSYLSGSDVIEGGIQRIKDVNIIPSPYLTGMLDEFFDLPLAPMIETTRGCPFSCSFCADGLPIKNKVASFNPDRVREELHYIAQHVKDIDELTVTDLNFGMYKRDLETARSIAAIQSEYDWPVLIKGSSGKNHPERIIEAVRLLKGSWVIGSAIQSSDPEVLKNIKRSNIALDAYQKFLDFMNKLDKDAQTYTEVILALPGDTKEKHFESLRYGVDNRANSLRMYQAIMLTGTEMASQATRDKFELVTKWRTIPGGVGVYQFGTDRIKVAEVEEIIVGSKDLSFDDYVSCRVMDLLVETYVNNALCEEIFAALLEMGLNVFDFLIYFHAHDEFYTPKFKGIIQRFIEATRDDLYESHDQAESSALNSDLFIRYQSNDLGTNELIEHKAMLYQELEDTIEVLIRAVANYLEEKRLSTSSVLEYFDQLAQLILCRKKEVQNSGLVTERTFNYDFEAIEKLNYHIDPREIEINSPEVGFKFFHDQVQKSQIENAVALYKNHTGGIGRMLYRQNLKKLYRNFKKV